MVWRHDYDADVVARFQGVDARTGGFVKAQWEDVSNARLASMDAADELERAVDKLGLKDAMIHGLAGPERLLCDDRRFWPIYERVQALDVPLYIHPANPRPPAFASYYPACWSAIRM